MIFVSNNEPSEVVKPCEQSLHFPASSVSSKLPAVLRSILATISSVGSNHYNAAFCPKLSVKTVTVIGLVTDQARRVIGNELSVEGFFYESNFMRRSTFDPNGDRKTSAVCNCHDLGPLATLGFPDFGAPFLAPLKEPSMKASLGSILPRSYRSSARFRRTFSNVPSSTHCWKRRWQVWYGGYRSGRSFHGAPVLKTHRIPLRTSRDSRQGRPLPSSRRGNSGRRDSTTSHCLSVRSMHPFSHGSRICQFFGLTAHNHL